MTLEERAEEAARKAKCFRCRRGIMSAPLKAYIKSVSVRWHATGESEHLTLCGPCGGDLSEFLTEERWAA